MARAKDILGRRGEDVAVEHLVRSGLVVLERNWRCRDGEIDIVASDGHDLVVCEVKTRTSVGFGTPIEAVTPTKLMRLRRLASCWLAEHPQTRARHVRVDVVGILIPPGATPVIEHVRGVEP